MKCFNSQSAPKVVAAVLALLFGTSELSTEVFARETTVANGLSPLDVLVLKDQIREEWADYEFLLGGDGAKNGEHHWADHVLTKSGRWLWLDPDGEMNRNLVGAAEMNARDTKVPSKTLVRQSSAKHIPVWTKFDDITPNRIKTRTQIMNLGVLRAKDPGQPDGVPGLGVPGVPQVGMAVYHDTWVKENGKWLKEESFLVSSSKGFWPPTPTK